MKEGRAKKGLRKEEEPGALETRNSGMAKIARKGEIWRAKSAAKAENGGVRSAEETVDAAQGKRVGQWREEAAVGNLRKSNPNRELYSFVYSLAYNYADDAE